MEVRKSWNPFSRKGSSDFKQEDDWIESTDIDELICPITLSLINDPVQIVFSKNNHCYERKSIETHFLKSKADPMSNEFLGDLTLKSVPELIPIIQNFKENAGLLVKINESYRKQMAKIIVSITKEEYYSKIVKAESKENPDIQLVKTKQDLEENVTLVGKVLGEIKKHKNSPEYVQAAALIFQKIKMDFDRVKFLSQKQQQKELEERELKQQGLRNGMAELQEKMSQLQEKLTAALKEAKVANEERYVIWLESEFAKKERNLLAQDNKILEKKCDAAQLEARHAKEERDSALKKQVNWKQSVMHYRQNYGSSRRAHIHRINRFLSVPK